MTRELGEAEQSLFQEGQEANDGLAEPVGMEGMRSNPPGTVKSYQRIVAGIPEQSTTGRTRFLASTGGQFQNEKNHRGLDEKKDADEDSIRTLLFSLVKK